MIGVFRDLLVYHPKIINVAGVFSALELATLVPLILYELFYAVEMLRSLSQVVATMIDHADGRGGTQW